MGFSKIFSIKSNTKTSTRQPSEYKSSSSKRKDSVVSDRFEKHPSDKPTAFSRVKSSSSRYSFKPSTKLTKLKPEDNSYNTDHAQTPTLNLNLANSQLEIDFNAQNSRRKESKSYKSVLDPKEHDFDHKNHYETDFFYSLKKSNLDFLSPASDIGSQIPIIDNSKKSNSSSDSKTVTNQNFFLNNNTNSKSKKSSNPYKSTFDSSKNGQMTDGYSNFSVQNSFSAKMPNKDSSNQYLEKFADLDIDFFSRENDLNENNSSNEHSKTDFEEYFGYVDTVSGLSDLNSQQDQHPTTHSGKLKASSYERDAQTSSSFKGNTLTNKPKQFSNDTNSDLVNDSDLYFDSNTPSSDVSMAKKKNHKKSFLGLFNSSSSKGSQKPQKLSRHSKMNFETLENTTYGLSNETKTLNSLKNSDYLTISNPKIEQLQINLSKQRDRDESDNDNDDESIDESLPMDMRKNNKYQQELYNLAKAEEQRLEREMLRKKEIEIKESEEKKKNRVYERMRQRHLREFKINNSGESYIPAYPPASDILNQNQIDSEADYSFPNQSSYNNVQQPIQGLLNNQVIQSAVFNSTNSPVSQSQKIEYNGPYIDNNQTYQFPTTNDSRASPNYSSESELIYINPQNPQNLQSSQGFGPVYSSSSNYSKSTPHLSAISSANHSQVSMKNSNGQIARNVIEENNNDLSASQLMNSSKTNLKKQTYSKNANSSLSIDAGAATSFKNKKSNTVLSEVAEFMDIKQVLEKKTFRFRNTVAQIFDSPLSSTKRSIVKQNELGNINISDFFSLSENKIPAEIHNEIISISQSGHYSNSGTDELDGHMLILNVASKNKSHLLSHTRSASYSNLDQILQAEPESFLEKSKLLLRFSAKFKNYKVKQISKLELKRQEYLEAKASSKSKETKKKTLDVDAISRKIDTILNSEDSDSGSPVTSSYNTQFGNRPSESASSNSKKSSSQGSKVIPGAVLDKNKRFSEQQGLPFGSQKPSDSRSAQKRVTLGQVETQYISQPESSRSYTLPSSASNTQSALKDSELLNQKFAQLPNYIQAPSNKQLVQQYPNPQGPYKQQMLTNQSQTLAYGMNMHHQIHPNPPFSKGFPAKNSSSYALPNKMEFMETIPEEPQDYVVPDEGLSNTISKPRGLRSAGDKSRVSTHSKTNISPNSSPPLASSALSGANSGKGVSVPKSSSSNMSNISQSYSDGKLNTLMTSSQSKLFREESSDNPGRKPVFNVSGTAPAENKVNLQAVPQPNSISQAHTSRMIGNQTISVGSNIPNGVSTQNPGMVQFYNMPIQGIVAQPHIPIHQQQQMMYRQSQLPNPKMFIEGDLVQNAGTMGRQQLNPMLKSRHSTNALSTAYNNSYGMIQPGQQIQGQVPYQMSMPISVPYQNQHAVQMQYPMQMRQQMQVFNQMQVQQQQQLQINRQAPGNVLYSTSPQVGSQGNLLSTPDSQQMGLYSINNVVVSSPEINRFNPQIRHSTSNYNITSSFRDLNLRKK
ncbi:hypothetical protein BB560_001267 [Smittium megazygosporum]|uniref:Uncharacterized protein n=1 Tax=Smittium megazygosporum TaxID=133381 RepID=A0A2T9ZI02_9FUNG|nr:hypothetical protein BB560_001267 [Smittium megazygosporum]